MNTTRFVILGLLAEGPCSGYDIKKSIEIRFRYFWNESYGQLYPMLKELEGQDCIRELPPEEGTEAPGRKKKIYGITLRGRELLEDWLSLPPGKELTRMEILIKVYFGNLIAPETLTDHLRGFGEAHRQDLSRLLAFQEELTRLEALHPNHPFILATISLGIRINRAYTEWAEETARYFREQSAPAKEESR